MDTKHTIELNEEETRQIAEDKKAHAERIWRVVSLIEDALTAEGCTWGDWNEIIELFNKRAEKVVPQITIKSLKQRFDKLTT